MPALIDEADAAIAKLRSRPNAASIRDGRTLLTRLRDARAFARLIDLAESLTRLTPDDAEVRALYAQGLIDTGRASVAIDVLQAALGRPTTDERARPELYGLIGRANKQIFMDAADRSTHVAQRAITEAIEAYRVPFALDPGKYWHGVNLAAVVHAARRAGRTPPEGLDCDEIAQKVLRSLHAAADDRRDSWWDATRAEAHIALGEWREAELALRDYVRRADIPIFNFAATLRQLREVWEIQREGPTGAGLLQLLESRLVARADAALELTPEYVRTMRQCPEPTPDQRERVLGDGDAQPIHWYRTALERAASVASVRLKAGKRFGTGFAVRASELGLATDEVWVLTNFHVVNREGLSGGERPSAIEIMFEAAGSAGLGPYRVASVVAESPFDGALDYALLKLEPAEPLPAPLPLTFDLPSLNAKPRVSVIGHPLANELHLSLQDNQLLDHEGPPSGTPAVPGRRLVHYFTPTAKGSSGSPVFDATWQVIALHHAGARHDPKLSEFGLLHLNGKPGRYSANEGIWIGSVREDLAWRAERGRLSG